MDYALPLNYLILCFFRGLNESLGAGEGEVVHSVMAEDQGEDKPSPKIRLRDSSVIDDPKDCS